MVARAVPVQAGSTSSAMAVPHGPASVSTARRRLRSDLGDRSIPEAVIDDAVLILSELLSNSCRHARPLGPEGDGAADEEAESGTVLVSWQMLGDGLLTLEVTDGGAVTRPVPASPSVTAHGGRGLSIVGKLARDWGVRHAPGQVTVWAQLPAFGQVAGGGRRRSA
ncbi:ATP-binding protein [Kitasatospora sp. NA04385]|uniref:ATP-binding protein n=1 Tax=Kitasatospora sp. NA04385 TaxID=2742135 RepID=UPI00159161E5|nr:ATP-binding protein [Kitasatospora sp. NA04385]QKW24316.1 ATP-binding protein [Kitasatospora sp. NA04385]